MSRNSIATRSLSADGASVHVRHPRNNRSTRDRQTMQRTIIKQGYLKKLPNASRLGSSFKKVERRWFIFGVIGHSDPYLEYYENEDSIFGSEPLNIVFLDTCRNITRNQKTTRFSNIFTLVLKDRLLSLVAPTRDAMFEWSRAIEEKLFSLGIMEETAKGTNDYIRIPNLRHSFHAPEPTYPPERNYLEIQASGGSQQMVRAALTQAEVVDQREAFYANVPKNLRGAEDVYDVSINKDTDEYDNRRPMEIGDDVYMRASNAREQNNATPDADIVYLSVTQDDEDLYVNTRYNGDVDCLDAVPSDPPSPIVQSIDHPSVDQTSGNGCHSSSNADVEDDRDDVARASNLCGPSEPRLTLAAGLPSGASSSAVSEQQSSESGSVALPGNSSSTQTSEHAHPSIPKIRSVPLPMPLTMSSPESNGPGACSSPVGLPTYDQAVQSPKPADEDIPRRSVLRSVSSHNSRTVPGSNGDEAPSSNRASMHSRSGDGDQMLPPPYSAQKMLLKNVNMPLKQAQTQKLIDEMNVFQGIEVVVPMNQCRRSVVFAECFNRIWITGWNQQTCPSFQSFLHVGDQVISINDMAPGSRAMAKKLLKAGAGKKDATMRIKRIPCGRVVFVHKKNGTADSLGLTLVNRTAEIGSVDPSGPAHESGLEETAPAMDGLGGERGSWWITEINHQPLNLFLKDDEAKQRLNSVGSHVSFVVHPTRLILEMKRQLRNTKNFRDFIVQ